ncbi:VOC family protein [uncultured Tolumonas sp.]|uniref:VOC family protein n=1 Tax=uncultured Tolumonas sp. TaxID=263765 RepID=UPI00292CCCF4|nr:VOC family protein [uncultured Tolumonas sp.]
MKFGYAIVYVPDVEQTLSFFEQAFSWKRKFIHESGEYGELNTGDTTLAFASHNLGEINLPNGYIAVNDTPKPLGFELAFVVDDVDMAHLKAITAGATELSVPKQKPWGQRVSYIQTPSGILIELCSPMNN